MSNTLSRFLNKKLGGKLILDSRWTPDRKFKIECGQIVPSVSTIAKLVREYYGAQFVDVVFDEFDNLMSEFTILGQRYWIVITPIYQANPVCILVNVAPL